MKIFSWIVLGLISLGTIYLAADLLMHKIKIKAKSAKNKEKTQKNQ